MAISADQVKQLREKTGAGMMDCKKALEKSGGDMQKAADYLREQGITKATQKASRIAKEGLIVSFIGEQDRPLSRRPEYDGLVNLRRRLEQALGFTISLHRLRRSVERGLNDEDSLEIHMNPEQGSDRV